MKMKKTSFLAIIFSFLIASTSSLLFIPEVSEAYGGGGSRRYSSQCDITAFNYLPWRNSTVNRLEEISLLMRNIDTTQVFITIDDQEASVQFEETAENQYQVRAYLDEPITRNGSVVIEINASKERNCKNGKDFIYAVNIDGSYEQEIEIPEEPESRSGSANACGTDKKVIFDGTHKSNQRYTDIAGHWASPFINDLTNRCIVHGYKLGSTRQFDPNGALTRAEVSKIALRTFVSPIPKKVTAKPFADIPPNEWHAVYIALGKNTKIINGFTIDGNQYFYPHNKITRAEALKIIIVSSGVDVSVDPAGLPYEDVDTGLWYGKYIAWAYQNDIISGSKDKFYPNGNITRGEFAAITSRLIDHLGY